MRRKPSCMPSAPHALSAMHGADSALVLGEAQLGAQVPHAAVGTKELGPLRAECVNHRPAEVDVGRARALLLGAVAVHARQQLHAAPDDVSLAAAAVLQRALAHHGHRHPH
eukprot:scaffold59053_cov33-Phaeocystis_antarctica.AAC.1